MEQIRKPVVAGQFYESNAELLKKQITSCFLGNLGPKKMPEKNETAGKIIGAIVPHAGYIFSGQCAAHAYYELSKYFINTVLLLGPNHTGISNSLFSCSLKNFETPFGVIKNNKTFVQDIIEKTEAEHDESAHLHEHSLEVQLPFLQFIYKDFTIAPIVVSTTDYEACKRFSLQLLKLIKNKKEKNFLVLASSDFTHYGYNYGFMPFMPNENLSENLKKFDKKAIEEILKLNGHDFCQKARNTTICGIAPIIIVTEIFKLLKKKAKLLCYYTSADIIKNNNAVGYASIFFG